MQKEERKRKEEANKMDLENESVDVENEGVIRDDDDDEQTEWTEEDVQREMEEIVKRVEKIAMQKEANKTIRGSRERDIGIPCHAEELEKVANWRMWLDKVCEPVTDIRDYYQYRFDKSKSSDGKPCVMLRKRHFAAYNHRNPEEQWPYW